MRFPIPRIPPPLAPDAGRLAQLEHWVAQQSHQQESAQ